jgi:hypothetical protein
MTIRWLKVVTSELPNRPIGLACDWLPSGQSQGRNLLRRKELLEAGISNNFRLSCSRFPGRCGSTSHKPTSGQCRRSRRGRNFPLARLIASRQSYPSPARKRRQLQLKLPGFHNRLQSLKLAGSRFNRLRVQDKGPSEESRFELFVSFARLRCDFGKLAFSAQIVEQRIRFEIGIAEETAFNTALQHSP